MKKSDLFPVQNVKNTQINVVGCYKTYDPKCYWSNPNERVTQKTQKLEKTQNNI